MNKTTEATYDAARRMLKGKIEVEEVCAMLGLPEDVVRQLQEEVCLKNPDSIENLDVTNLDLGPIIFDNNDTNDAYDANY